MTSRFDRQQLRVAPPTLEPDAVLLGRLAALSSASVPAPRTARSGAVRLLAVATSVAAIGATTWVAGALPGVDSPVGPAHAPSHGPATPGSGTSEPPPSDAATASGSPSSPGLPDATDPTGPDRRRSGTGERTEEGLRGRGHADGDARHDGRHDGRPDGRGNQGKGPRDKDQQEPRGPKDGHGPRGPRHEPGPEHRNDPKQPPGQQGGERGHRHPGGAGR